jgi:hypothetical protein
MGCAKLYFSSSFCYSSSNLLFAWNKLAETSLCIFGGYFVFLIFLGELRLLFSSALLRLLLERTLAVSAAASILSSTLLIKPLQLALKLLILV